MIWPVNFFDSEGSPIPPPATEEERQQLLESEQALLAEEQRDHASFFANNPTPHPSAPKPVVNQMVFPGPPTATHDMSPALAPETIIPLESVLASIKSSLPALAPVLNSTPIGFPAPPCPSSASVTASPPLKESPRLPTPYETARTLLSHEKIIISGNALYFFDGRIYRLLSREDILRLITDRCREAVKAAGHAGYVEQVFKCLYTEPDICFLDLQPSPNHIVFWDGLLDLETHEFLPHSPNVFATSLLDVNFSEGQREQCPVFDQFVQSIADGDEELEVRIWEVIGYTLTQDQRGKCLVLFQGPSDSGKSILGNFIRGCINPEAVSSLDLQSFGGNFALADLIGKRLCLDLDLPAGAINARAASMVKKLTGGDLLSTDVKYMPRVSFLNTAKLLFASNHAVVSDLTDSAFLRRLIVVPFYRSVPRELQDTHLLENLLAERDSVVVKSLQFYQALKSRNYRFSGDFRPNEALGSDPDSDSYTLISKFLRSSFVAHPDSWVPTQLLWERFSLEYQCDLSIKTFSERFHTILPAIFPAAKKARSYMLGGKNAVNGYRGISFRDA